MLKPRNDLLDADRGDVQFRHVGREIGVAFIGADDHAAGLGDGEVAAGHPDVGREDQRTGRLPLRFREIMYVAVAGVGADRLGENGGNVRPELVHGRHDDMTRVFIVELLDALPEVALSHLDADRGHVRAEPALLGEHRLALDQRFGAVVLEDAVDDVVVLGGVLGPVHMDAIRLRIRLELLQVLIEMDERVLLDG